MILSGNKTETELSSLEYWSVILSLFLIAILFVCYALFGLSLFGAYLRQKVDLTNPYLTADSPRRPKPVFVPGSKRGLIRFTCVKFPLDHVPKFPDLCIVSLKPHPDSTFRYKIGRYRVVENITALLFGRKQTIQVPVMSVHRSEIYGKRIKVSIAYMLELLAIFWILGVFDSFLRDLDWNLLMSSSYSVTWSLIIIGGIFLATFLFNSRFPPYFRVREQENHTNYEFRSQEYAERFAEANGLELSRK